MRSIFLLFCVSGVAADASNHCNSNDADGHALLQARSAVRQHRAMSDHVDAEVTAEISHHAMSDHVDAEVTAEIPHHAIAETTAQTIPQFEGKFAGPDQSAAETRILHREGLCPLSGMLLGEHRTQADSVEECADFCQTYGIGSESAPASGGCEYFAYDQPRSQGFFNCFLYAECPCYHTPADPCIGFSNQEESFSSLLPPVCEDDRWMVYQLLEPGTLPPPPPAGVVRIGLALPETLQERCGRERSEMEEFTCSQDRDTGGSCRVFGCWGQRGETECVAGHCVCKPGQCANDEGVCVPQDDYHTQRCEGMSAPGSDDSSLTDEDRFYRDLVCSRGPILGVTID